MLGLLLRSDGIIGVDMGCNNASIQAGINKSNGLISLMRRRRATEEAIDVVAEKGM